MTINWQQIRSNYLLPSNQTYFNSASFGALSKRTAQVQKDCLEGWQMNGNLVLDEAHAAATYVRNEFLNLLNASEHQSALLTDVSTGMNLLAEVFGNSRRVVLFEKDFPAVNMPFIGRNFDIQWIKRKNYTYNLEEVESALEKGVDVLVVSWVMYNSGAKLDIRAIGELCEQYETTFVVDATQGLGAHALDLSEVKIDVLLNSCFKWFLAGYGTCMMVCRKSFLERYPIEAAGQYTVINGEEDLTDPNNHRQGIERFELGHIKILPVLGLSSSLKELKEIGFDAIQYRTTELMEQMHTGLTDANIEILTPEHRSNNIVMVEATVERIKRLNDQKIACTCRNGLIRLGLYFYNNEEDISKAIQALN